MFISFIALLGCIGGVLSHPIKRDVTADVKVLVFADLLEQLESAYYTQALEHFNSTSFEAAGFASPQIPIQQIQTIASDENTHDLTLQSAILALGGQVVSNCTFNFSSALTDVSTMIAVARVVENVGVSAYLGALSSLTDPTLVTAAASIMTIEARHQTILNLLSNATSIPQPFDVELTPADVLAVAGSFVSGCQLGFTANPPLTVTNSGPLQAGTQLNFSSPALNGSTPSSQLSCQIVTGASNTTSQPIGACTVPAGVIGPMYVFITTDQSANNSSSNTNGTSSATIVAGPALLFVNQQDLIGDLILPGTTAGSGSMTPTATQVSTIPPTASSTSSSTGTPALSVSSSTGPTAPILSSGSLTTTISPAEASSILSGLTS